ncbi:hypothetical protein QM012_006364 [Aureobasidium pullulans]|uniref:Cytochrome P450 n=1 Tax=Aureobasidium pullulans TaxID=5580 RepID=A0ABR0TNE5_AURPU
MAVYKDEMPRKNVEVHKKYGSVVRIGPKHVSFSSPEALQTIHGNRQAFPKSDFYKQTVAQFEGLPLYNLFSIQDIDYHTSLKKRIGGLYTKAAVADLEPNIDACLKVFKSELQKMTQEGPASIDMSLWVHLFSFDCLGELNISKPFGFLKSGTDITGWIRGSDRLLIMTGLYAQAPFLQWIQKMMEAVWGMRKTNPILLKTSSLVQERIKMPTSAPDMLNKFLNLQESQPDKITRREITGSVYINLMAGHDVLAVTIRAILYYVARTPSVEAKLRDEIAALSSRYTASELIPYSALMDLKYLDAVINESLRIHGNLGLVNERVVPKGGAVIEGYKLPAGTIVGINPWVIHRNPEIFGPDVEVFRPARWIDSPEEQINEMKRNLFSFGAGPRMCIGKNIAMMQICKFIVEFYRAFDAKLSHPEQEWHVVGNWVTKQSNMDMEITQHKETLS